MTQVVSPPFFSIIVPVYNGEKYLSATIKSVISQTERNWELIMVDDASADRSPEILAQYAAKYPNIRIFRNETNAGIAKSLNCGIREAGGEWIVRLDSDDLFTPAYLEILRSHIHSLPNPDVFISTWVTLIDGKGEKVLDVSLPSAKKIAQMMRAENFLIQSATSFPKRVWSQVGGYPDKDRNLSEDTEMWKRFLKCGISLVMVPQRLVFYRIHDSNITSFKDGQVGENDSLDHALVRQRGEWLISLFLKQGELKAARREILSLKETQQNLSIKNIFFFFLTFFPIFLVHVFMWEIRPRTRSFGRAFLRRRTQIRSHPA